MEAKKVVQRQKSLLLFILRKHMIGSYVRLSPIYSVPYVRYSATVNCLVLFPPCNPFHWTDAVVVVVVAVAQSLRTQSTLGISQKYTRNKINCYHFQLIYCIVFNLVQSHSVWIWCYVNRHLPHKIVSVCRVWSEKRRRDEREGKCPAHDCLSNNCRGCAVCVCEQHSIRIIVSQSLKIIACDCVVGHWWCVRVLVQIY